MICPYCKHHNPEGNALCEDCGASLEPEPEPATSTGHRGSTVTAVTAVKIAAPRVRTTIPHTNIVLGDGEKVWREYPVAQLRKKKQGLGTLFVTDSRLVFHVRASGKRTGRVSELIQETKVDQVTGLGAYVSRQPSRFLMLVSFLLGLFALASLVRGSGPGFIVFALLCGGAIWATVFLANKRRKVGLRVWSSLSQPTAIGFGDFGQHGFIANVLSGLFGPLYDLFQAKTAFDVLLGYATQEADDVIAELGALVIDLQSKGSLAETHWGVSGVAATS